MLLIQRSFLLWPKLWISPHLFLGKILTYSSKSFGNFRDPRLGLPWNWYFVRYHQSPPLILHVLSLAGNGSSYSKFFWTRTRLQNTLTQSRNNPKLNYFGVRGRQKKTPSLEQGSLMDRSIPKMGLCTIWQLPVDSAEWGMAVCLGEGDDKNQNEFSKGE